MLRGVPRSDAPLTVIQRRVLEAVMVDDETELADLLRGAALRLHEAIPALADLVAGRHIVTRQEVRDGRMVRLYRRALPTERFSPVTVEYDKVLGRHRRGTRAAETDYADGGWDSR